MFFIIFNSFCLKHFNNQVEYTEKCSGCIMNNWICLNIQRLRDFESLVDIVKYAEWIQNKTLADSQLPT